MVPQKGIIEMVTIDLAFVLGWTPHQHEHKHSDGTMSAATTVPAQQQCSPPCFAPVAARPRAQTLWLCISAEQCARVGQLHKPFAEIAAVRARATVHLARTLVPEQATQASDVVTVRIAFGPIAFMRRDVDWLGSEPVDARDTFHLTPRTTAAAAAAAANYMQSHSAHSCVAPSVVSIELACTFETRQQAASSSLMRANMQVKADGDCAMQHDKGSNSRAILRAVPVSRSTHPPQLDCPCFVLISVVVIVAPRQRQMILRSPQRHGICLNSSVFDSASTRPRKGQLELAHISILRIVLRDRRYRTIRMSWRLVKDTGMRHFQTAVTRPNDAVGRACSCLNIAHGVECVCCVPRDRNHKGARCHVGKP
ncbi:hypothetical protein DOTSEDRAFT_34807 [Dothistroma septosporum NZE10]|uniref:Uncharacterized protein n=1 Tax=Dothistroma septosporum (strain NZE10 / CBS 128990) TaxID=675120 RepID=N1PPP1_DOTSN|nr:hypothetical protein DOTSEDRAFT_34807 [Dothistroma septosporum NZE10]